MQGAGGGQAVDQTADGAHLAVGKGRLGDGLAELLPLLREGGGLVVEQEGYLLQELEGIHLNDRGEAAKHVGNASVLAHMPMLAWGMVAQVFLQLFRHDMSAEGDDKLGRHLLLALGRHGIDGSIEVTDGQAGRSSVAQVFGEPSEIAAKRFHVGLLEEVDEVHLSHHDHAFAQGVEPVDEAVVVAVVDVEALIARDDARRG
jgi:hypothetical protein